MNTKESALMGLVAAIFSLVCCQIFVHAAGYHAQLSRAQISAGLTICLAGIAVGLLLVLCISAFKEAGSGWDRPLGAVGLAFGCALLFILVGRHMPHADPAPQATTQESASPHWVVSGRGALLLAPGTSR